MNDEQSNLLILMFRALENAGHFIERYYRYEEIWTKLGHFYTTAIYVSMSFIFFYNCSFQKSHTFYLII